MMGAFLLSIASPEFLSWLGFVVLGAALVGEAGICIVPANWSTLHKELAFALAVLAATGYAIERVGDDAVFTSLEKRASTAEKTLNELKVSGVAKPPRTLTTEQQAQVSAEIRPWAQQAATFNVAQDVNSIALLRLLRKTLINGGWILEKSQIGDIELDGAGVAYGSGVEVQVHSDSAQGKVAGAAVALANALVGVGIAARAVVNPKLKSKEAINIVVGTRPE